MMGLFRKAGSSAPEDEDWEGQNGSWLEGIGSLKAKDVNKGKVYFW